ncbi:MAG: RNA-binding transcriptional accessory protein [Thiomargarita sp.]|nr:RNA-binding transcriptional accessory protein [Thiomargarita sp.]
MKTIALRIAEELSVEESQVQATINLLDGGATVPFIARYRKEATAGLDDTQLRTLEEKLRYIRDLDERREFILAKITEFKKLTPELEIAINQAKSKTILEDLYLPFKPKRRSKAQQAIESGLEPLATILVENPQLVPEEAAKEYINVEKKIENEEQALVGARYILMERWGEDAKLLEELRNYIQENATLQAKIVEGKEEKAAKFSDYFDHSEALKNVPSHRALALFRGRKLGFLQLSILLEGRDETGNKVDMSADYGRKKIANCFNIENKNNPADNWLLDTISSAWRLKIKPHLDAQLLTKLRESSENEAIKVFASNLQDLLLAAPAGQQVTMGLDPGLRTGVKVAIVDETGKLIETTTIYPHPPKKKWQQSIEILANLAMQHNVNLVSIGNGTASRETDKLVSELIKQHPDLGLYKIVVSEAGASVYSASKTAAEEFPDVDVSLRGAVSIARRLQDPLAELVKIEPKSIGVGQYQHDVNKKFLTRSLNSVIEDCVNAVGVDLNTASIPLLAQISGLNLGLARNIIEFRDQNGIFKNRELLKQVPRLGEKSFEQAAGFLRITNGDNPLDASSVHPEAYPIIERIITKTEKPIQSLIGDANFLRNLNPKDYIDEVFGVPTVTDILKELEKPGRDPRPEFKMPTFREEINDLEDLASDMVLEGVVTNVTNFGAFVDIGVHHDGLVHISALSSKYVKDPRDVVKAGDVVTIKVLSIDLKRRRIALSLDLAVKNNQESKASKPKQKKKGNDRKSSRRPRNSSSKKFQGNSANKSQLVGVMEQAFANINIHKDK